MIIGTELSDYAIWLVSFALYSLDAARLLSSGEVLLVEQSDGRFSTRVVDYPFVIAGRSLAVYPPWLPHKAVFLARWGRKWAEPSGLRAAIEELSALGETLWVPRVLAVGMAAVLFIFGPLLTLRLGPSVAIIYVAASAYPIAIAWCVFVWVHREVYGLGAGAAAWLSIEALLCPVLVANAVRKVTIAQRIDVDGIQLVLAKAREDDREQLIRDVDAVLRERLESIEASDPDAEELHLYQSRIKEAPWV